MSMTTASTSSRSSPPPHDEAFPSSVNRTDSFPTGARRRPSRHRRHPLEPQALDRTARIGSAALTRYEQLCSVNHPRATPYRCFYVCQGCSGRCFRRVLLAAAGGHDRDGPLSTEGRLLSGQESQQLREWARGGRRIVTKTARWRQPISGSGRVPGPTLRSDHPKPGKQGRVGHNLILPADYGRGAVVGYRSTDAAQISQFRRGAPRRLPAGLVCTRPWSLPLAVVTIPATVTPAFARHRLS